MTVKLKNNVVGYLATQISTTDTGLALNSGNGANFPTLGFGEYFYATLVSAGGTIEIVKVTARSGDALTVLRAQEGTTAAGFASGSRVELRVTAQSVLDAITDATAATVLVNPYGQQFTCTEGQTAFTLTTNPGSLYNLDVSLNGSTLVAGTDYTWVGTTLTLEDGAHAGDILFARYTAATSVASIANGSVTDASVATGSVLASLIAAGPGAPYAHTYTATAGQTAFTLTKNPGSINNIQVVVDGAQLTPGIDFTWSGVTVTMTAPLFAGNHVLIRYSSSDAVATVPTGGVSDASIATGSILYDSVLAVNVKHFGATGNGSTDDTAAIQAAINSLPLAPSSPYSPKGTAQGGTIYFPRGRYKVSSKLTLRRGINVRGESHEASQVLSFVNADSVFQYTDIGGYLQDEIGFSNLSIWQDASVVASAGAAIDLIDGAYTPDSIQVRISNVLVEGTYDGIRIAAGVGCSVSDCNVSRCVRYGIHLAQITTSNTSTTLQNCYTHLNGSHGVFVQSASYVSVIGCASDSNTGYGYAFQSANGFGVYASGAEQNTVGGGYFKDTLSGFVQLHVVGQAGSVHGITMDNANGLTLANCDFLSDAGTTGYAVNFVTPTHVLVLGPSYTGGWATNKFSSANYGFTLNGAAYIKGGDTAIWTFGQAAAKDTTAQIACVGNTESTVSIGLKAGVTFTAANPTRNSASQAQAITANTAVIYPLVIGQYIPDVGRGTASTINRLAGQYIVQQTQGGVANANLMIDAGSGTVPAGTWSIYNDSLRENLFKGPIRWDTSGPLDTFGANSPEGVVTAPVGSTYRRTNGGAGTSFYVKESGTGNTGWVGK